SSTETPYYMLMGQWVSHPASGPGVLEFDHQVAWSMAESNSAADMHPYVLVYVLRDEANLAGVAINRWYSAGAAELPTSHQGRLLVPGTQLSAEGPVPFQA